MKARIFLAFAILLIATIFYPQKIQAQEKAAGSSATLQSVIAATANDDRVYVLQKYLEKYNSPLAPYAEDFVTQADLYNIDWRLLPAISGVESTFGKEVPCINAWGWGITSSGTYCFNSYTQAIHVISQGLRRQYMDKWGATDVWSIGSFYNPGSTTWAGKVNYFMNDITQFSYNPQDNPLQPNLE